MGSKGSPGHGSAVTAQAAPPGGKRRARASRRRSWRSSRRCAGSGFGQLVEAMESEWFSAGKVFFAVLVGIAGSWASAYVGGARTGLAEAVPVVFPRGIVASFVVCRYAGGAAARCG
ncbi:hypothetical protein GCM10018987_08640 [Streptomyces cremeus]